MSSDTHIQLSSAARAALSSCAEAPEKAFWRAEALQRSILSAAGIHSRSPPKHLCVGCRAGDASDAVPRQGPLCVVNPISLLRSCAATAVRRCPRTLGEVGWPAVHKRPTVSNLQVVLRGSRQQMCLPAEPPEMTAVGAPAGQTKQVGHQHGLFRLVGERKSCWRLADGS